MTARSPLVRAAPYALAAMAVALLVGCLVEAWPFTVDDTYITLRYSRNVAEGFGPTYNHAGPRAEGYTTFLWMLLLVGPHWAGLDAVVCAKALGIAATFATLGVVARWAWVEGERLRAAGRELRPWAAAAAVACFAAVPATSVHAVSGMETPLFTLLLTGMFAASADAVRGRRPPHRIVAWALFAALTRPEGNLAALIVMATTAGVLARGGPEPRDARSAAVARTRAKHLVVAAVFGWVAPVALYELWRRHYYGLAFPLPFYVKLATPGRLPGWPDVAEWLAGPVLRLGVLVVPVLIRPPRALWPALAAVATLTAFFVFPQHQMGYDHRYLAPLDPTLAVLAGVGFARVCAHGARRRLAPAGAAAGLALALGVDAAGAPGVLEGEADYGRGLRDAHARLGRDLYGLGRPDGRLVISDAGAAPYFSRWWTLDLVGLNDAHIATAGRPEPAWVLAQQPDVVVLASARPDRFETWDWNPWESALFDACTAHGFVRVTERRFADDYWLWVLARPDSPAARGLGR